MAIYLDVPDEMAAPAPTIPPSDEPVLWSLTSAQWSVVINAGVRRWEQLFRKPSTPGVRHALSSWWQEGDGITTRCTCGELRHYDAAQVILMAVEGLIQQ